MVCDKCNDTGAYVVTHRETMPNGGELAGSSTIQCLCRAAIPPRQGRAVWWSSESVLSIDVKIPIFDESVSITVDAEVPMSKDNFRLQRRGNRYYPTLIHIEAPKDMTLHACTARDLARALIQAAEAAEKVDDADSAPCGHWAPCDCGEQAQSVPTMTETQFFNAVGAILALLGASFVVTGLVLLNISWSVKP